MSETPVPDLVRAQMAPHNTQNASNLSDVLLESRQRWRDLVSMAADLVFETDAHGRFVFMDPPNLFGWPASTLLGQPAELLLCDAASVSFNPFRPNMPIRRHRTWLKRPDGGSVCLSFSTAPLIDSHGRISGARGLAVDVTDQEAREVQVAASLRRGEVIDHILWRMRQEVMAPRMMQAVLDALINALGAEGAAVIDVLGPGSGPKLVHQAGGGAGSVLPTALALLKTDSDMPAQMTAADGRPVLACSCHTRFGEQIGLSLWRTPGSREWDGEDETLVASACGIIRMVIEHEAIQREMAKQARTDPLTGLLNRRAFLDEVVRHIDRLDREMLPGTLMFLDLDNFKPLNDRLGHEVGDEALRRLAALIRDTVRPTDIVARLGGDEFAVWLNGADQFTTAERADHLCKQVPHLLDVVTGGVGPSLGLSIGIAPRGPGSEEEIGSLIHRADLVMYEVKRAGRGHWRVSQESAG